MALTDEQLSSVRLIRALLAPVDTSPSSNPEQRGAIEATLTAIEAGLDLASFNALLRRAPKDHLAIDAPHPDGNSDIDAALNLLLTRGGSISEATEYWASLIKGIDRNWIRRGEKGEDGVTIQVSLGRLIKVAAAEASSLHVRDYLVAAGEFLAVAPINHIVAVTARLGQELQTESRGLLESPAKTELSHEGERLERRMKALLMLLRTPEVRTADNRDAEPAPMVVDAVLNIFGIATVPMRTRSPTEYTQYLKRATLVIVRSVPDSELTSYLASLCLKQSRRTLKMLKSDSLDTLRLTSDEKWFANLALEATAGLSPAAIALMGLAKHETRKRKVKSKRVRERIYSAICGAPPHRNLPSLPLLEDLATILGRKLRPADFATAKNFSGGVRAAAILDINEALPELVRNKSYPTVPELAVLIRDLTGMAPVDTELFFTRLADAIERYPLSNILLTIAQVAENIEVSGPDALELAGADLDTALLETSKIPQLEQLSMLSTHAYCGDPIIPLTARLLLGKIIRITRFLIAVENAAPGVHWEYDGEGLSMKSN